MDKTYKIIFVILGVLIVANLLFSIFGVNKNLNQVLKNLDESQAKLDQSIGQIDASKKQIDSLQADLSRFRLYVKDIQGRVEIMDLERKLNDSKFVAKRDSIKDRIKDLKRDVPVTGEDLPDIPTVPLN